MKPLVSIIIPTFNRAHFIGETLQSVLAQTYSKWECIVVDDGSLDYTKELLEFYVENDSRFQYHHRPGNRPEGANACRNYGFELSKGEFINYLDSDDLFSEEKIEKQVNLLEDAPKLSLATCKWGRFSAKNGNIIFKDLEAYKNFNSPETFFYALANSKGFFPSHTYLINRELVKKAGPWLEFLSMNQDAEFFVRILSNTESILFAKDEISWYRWGNQKNVSSYDDYKKVKDALNSWKLIEAYLAIRFKKEPFYFVEQAKRVFYLNLKSSFPELIKENSTFFYSQIKEEPSKLKRKMVEFLEKSKRVLK